MTAATQSLLTYLSCRGVQKVAQEACVVVAHRCQYRTVEGLQGCSWLCQAGECLKRLVLILWDGYKKFLWNEEKSSAVKDSFCGPPAV